MSHSHFNFFQQPLTWFSLFQCPDDLVRQMRGCYHSNPVWYFRKPPEGIKATMLSYSGWKMAPYSLTAVIASTRQRLMIQSAQEHTAGQCWSKARIHHWKWSKILIWTCCPGVEQNLHIQRTMCVTPEGLSQLHRNWRQGRPTNLTQSWASCLPSHSAWAFRESSHRKLTSFLLDRNHDRPPFSI